MHTQETILEAYFDGMISRREAKNLLLLYVGLSPSEASALLRDDEPDELEESVREQFEREDEGGWL